MSRKRLFLAVFVAALTLIVATTDAQARGYRGFRGYSTRSYSSFTTALASTPPRLRPRVYSSGSSATAPAATAARLRSRLWQLRLRSPRLRRLRLRSPHLWPLRLGPRSDGNYGYGTRSYGDISISGFGLRGY